MQSGTREKRCAMAHLTTRNVVKRKEVRLATSHVLSRLLPSLREVVSPSGLFFPEWKQKRRIGMSIVPAFAVQAWA
jgi:hypothetical protein